MTIIGNTMYAHILDNHVKLDTQAGFTTGSMIEGQCIYPAILY